MKENRKNSVEIKYVVKKIFDKPTILEPIKKKEDKLVRTLPKQ